MDFAHSSRARAYNMAAFGSVFQFQRRLWFNLGYYIPGLTFRQIRDAAPHLKEDQDYTWRRDVCYHAEECLADIPQAAEFLAWLKQPGNRPTVYGT